VFAKLDIGSRLELDQALRKRSIRSWRSRCPAAARSPSAAWRTSRPPPAGPAGL